MTETGITQERAKGLLHYDPDTGVFTWLVRVSSKKPSGSTAGSVDSSEGYVRITIDGKRYQAHRLAWLYVNGEFPAKQLDHINRVRTDNRICNLRLATNAENQQNKSIQHNNTSGYIGVSWNKQCQKWMAYIKINDKQIHLGRFTELPEAIAARKAAEKKHHQFQNP